MVLNVPASRVHRQRTAGMGLLETVFAVGITTMLVLVLCSFSVFSGKSFAALFNYVDLDDVNRIAMDKITKDVRQAKRVKSCVTNIVTSTITSITLEDSDGIDLTYTYNPSLRELRRVKGGNNELVLGECDQLNFVLGQRNTVAGGYDVYQAASPDTCKVVNVRWKCSRKIMGQIANTESVQTARIIIRKQGS